MHPEKMKAKYMKEDVWKSFFLKLQLGISHLHYRDFKWRDFNPIVHGGGKFTPTPLTCRIFFNNFFSTQAKSLKFSDFKFLSFRHNVVKSH